ncbi:GD14822 [Drosophila simulans]|uniref:GD14822 n=1 Tax=Drosophila simulans TaxID=7240 RepID=B4QQX2_DROSI|nr:GD14822 [Drosophila simulans]
MIMGCRVPGAGCLVPGSGCGNDCPLRAWILSGFRCRSLSRLAFWHFRSSPPPPSPRSNPQSIWAYRDILRHIHTSSIPQQQQHTHAAATQQQQQQQQQQQHRTGDDLVAKLYE